MKKPSTINGASSGPLTDMWRAWNRFWFNPADPTVLGLIRICAGLIVFYVHLCYTYDLRSLVGPDGWVNLQLINDYRHETPWLARSHDWSDLPPAPASHPEGSAEHEYFKKWGYFPEQAHARGYPNFSLWYVVTDHRWIKAAHVGILAVMFLFTIGLGTRVTSVLTWLAALSYIHRSPLSLFGMDTITNILLLYLMIGPSGAALSVDRLIQRWWTTYRALRGQGKHSAHLSPVETEGPAPMVSANFALRLMQVHVCVIYFASGISKLQGTAWWNGTAVWGTVANPEFSPIHFPFYLAFLEFICKKRWLWETIMSGTALFTLLFEIGFATLIWNRSLRWLMILGAVGLHAGIAWFMGLTMFSLSMLTLVLAFVPPEALHRLLEKLGRGLGGFTLVFNGRERAQARLASLIHAFDPWDQITWTDKPSHVHRLQLVGPKGEVLTGYALFERITRSLRLLWPLAAITWLPGMNILANRVFSRPQSNPIPATAAPVNEKVRT